MVRIIILLDRQTITRIDKNVLISDSKDYVELQVVGSNQKLNSLGIDRLQAIFWNSDGSTEYRDVDLTTGECTVPNTSITKDGFKISLYGVKMMQVENPANKIEEDDSTSPEQPGEYAQVVITTNRISVDVKSSGFDSPDDYPDAYSRVICRLDKIDKDIKKIKDKIESLHPVPPSNPDAPPTSSISAYVVKRTGG